MKKSPKLGWVVAVFMTLLLTVLTVACGSAPATEDTTTGDTTKEEVTEEDTTKDETTKEEVTKEETVSTVPVITHDLEGQEDCLMCHSVTGFKPSPADHADYTNELCTSCHKLAQ